MGLRFADKGIKLINIKGSGRSKKIGEFLKFLNNSGIIIYVIADGHRDVGESIGDWIKEGLLEENNYTRWNEEFEDTFEPGLIVSVMKEIAKENGFDFNVSEEDFKKEKEKSGKPVSKVLEKMLHERGQNLNKPVLGEKLGILIASEIKSGNRRESEAEKVIRRIFELAK